MLLFCAFFWGWAQVASSTYSAISHTSLIHSPISHSTGETHEHDRGNWTRECVKCESNVINIDVDLDLEFYTINCHDVFNETVTSHLKSWMFVDIKQETNSVSHTLCSQPIHLGVDFGPLSIVRAHTLKGGLVCGIQNVAGTQVEAIFIDEIDGRGNRIHNIIGLDNGIGPGKGPHHIHNVTDIHLPGAGKGKGNDETGKGKGKHETGKGNDEIGKGKGKDNNEIGKGKGNDECKDNIGKGNGKGEGKGKGHGRCDCAKCKGHMINLELDFNLEFYDCEYYHIVDNTKLYSRVFVDLVTKNEISHIPLCSQSIHSDSDQISDFLPVVKAHREYGAPPCPRNSSHDQTVTAGIELDFPNVLNSSQIISTQETIKTLACFDFGIEHDQIEITLLFDRRSGQRHLLDFVYDLGLTFSYLDKNQAQLITNDGINRLAVSIHTATGAHVSISRQPQILGMGAVSNNTYVPVLLITICLMISTLIIFCGWKAWNTSKRREERTNDVELGFLNEATTLDKSTTINKSVTVNQAGIN